ncbi:MAG: hypothetical protein J2P37_16035, partial [Ktedonobacteraceae bacterium]|nr:hypothetical protein [Ktedonobacteraceae bacterium]
MDRAMRKHMAAEAQIPGTPPPRRRPRILTIILLILALLALIHFIATTHSAYPTVKISDCTDLIRNTDYKKFIQVNSKTQVLDEIQFVDQLVGDQPASLVTVADTGPDHRLDAYVYGCAREASTPTLTLLFKKQGLLQGSVKVTQDNALSIGEQDPGLTQDISTLQDPLQENVYHEYVWQNGAFVQKPFAGLYPVTSRSEAEAMQEQANNGQTYPWTDPVSTAQQMAKDILQLTNAKTTLEENNGHMARVQIEQETPHLVVSVTLMRLLQNDNHGLWFVTQAHSPDMTIDALHQPLSSPITIHGNMTYQEDWHAS